MFKKTKKKAKGLETRIEREEFLDRLKNPKKYQEIEDMTAQDILQKIRERNVVSRTRRKTKLSPYDAGPDGAMGRILKKLTGK